MARSRSLHVQNHYVAARIPLQSEKRSFGTVFLTARNCGVIAPGNHWIYDSLRGAPLPGEAISRDPRNAGDGVPYGVGGAGVAGASCGTVDARSLHCPPVGRSVWKSDLLRAPDFGFARQDIQIIGVILLQQIGGIQAVGAAGGALAALQAVGDLVHLLLGGGG